MVVLVEVMPTLVLKSVDIVGEVPIIIAGSTMNSSPIKQFNYNDLTTLGIGRRQSQSSSIH
jgi:hypothetical protein